jgi:hypothetical protein
VNYPFENSIDRTEKSFYQCEKLIIRKKFVEKIYQDLTAEEKIFGEENCAISGEKFEEKMPIIFLHCKHFFKKEESLLEWIKNKNICPLCKTNIGF